MILIPVPCLVRKSFTHIILSCIKGGSTDKTTLSGPSDPIPWEEWDTNAPEAGRVLHFTPSELQTIYNNASTANSKISKHDALLAHLWARVNHARALPPSSLTYLDLTLGLRARLSFPQKFIGSPIMHVSIPYTSSSSSDASMDVAEVANSIRNHLEMCTPKMIGACLHDAAFEVSPQRLWRCFLGPKHILQTSWVQSGFQSVDFVGNGGPKLRYVQPVCIRATYVCE